MTTRHIPLLALTALTALAACGDLSPLRPVPTPTRPQTVTSVADGTPAAPDDRYRSTAQATVGGLAWELEHLDGTAFLQGEVDIDGSYVVAGPPELEWSGRRVRGTFEIVSAPSERGVWMERKGRQVFALIQDASRHGERPFDAGQQVEVREATLRTPADLERLPGGALDADTRQRLRQEDLVMVVSEDDLRIVASN